MDGALRYIVDNIVFSGSMRADMESAPTMWLDAVSIKNSIDIGMSGGRVRQAHTDLRTKKALH